MGGWVGVCRSCTWATWSSCPPAFFIYPKPFLHTHTHIHVYVYIYRSCTWATCSSSPSAFSSSRARWDSCRALCLCVLSTPLSRLISLLLVSLVFSFVLVRIVLSTPLSRLIRRCNSTIASNIVVIVLLYVLFLCVLSTPLSKLVRRAAR